MKSLILLTFLLSACLAYQKLQLDLTAFKAAQTHYGGEIKTHYGDPIKNGGCLSDETPIMNGPDGNVCASSCRYWSRCPTYEGEGVTAPPGCLGGKCFLFCRDGWVCPEGSQCNPSMHNVCMYYPR